MRTYNTIELKLRELGIGIADIAAASGFALWSVTRVIHRKSHNRVIQDVIADILDIQPETLWGLDYDPKAKKAIRNSVFGRRSKLYQVVRLDRPGDRMRKLRYERQMSLDTLEDATGIHVSALSRYENSGRRMSRKTIKRVALGLGVDPDRIQFGDEITKQPASPVVIAADHCNDSPHFPPSMGNVLPSNDGGTPENRRTQSETIHCQRAI